MKKMLFVMNPYAGQRRANRYLADILSIFNRAGYRGESYMTGGAYCRTMAVASPRAPGI